MSEEQKTYQQEQQHLDSVIEKMGSAIATTQNEIKKNDEKLAESKQGWSEVKVSESTYSGLMETALSVRQQQQILEQRENSKSQSERRLEILQRQINMPFFARLDFKEENKQISDDEPENDETIYIGLASFENEGNFFVYDWRAPISSIYYDGNLGNVKYITPSGEQEANVSLKRQFQIESNQIVTIFDTEQTVGDQMLLNALSGEASAKMKSIVTTIQSQQNKIIRDTNSDLLFVQGAAGSGKTSAVLQRIAYLLYQYRGQVTSSQVIMFSPNQLFSDYIDQVLPELGEQNMIQLTFFQYASRRLPRLNVETLQQRFEKKQTKIATLIDQFKGSLPFFEAVEKYANSLNKKGLAIRDVKFHKNILFSKKEIQDVYYSYNDNYKLSQRLEATEAIFSSRVTNRIKKEMKQQWVEDAIQLLSKEEYDELLGQQVIQESFDEDNQIVINARKANGQVQSKREFASEEEEYNTLARKIVVKALNPVLRRIKRAGFINFNSQLIEALKAIVHIVDLEEFGLNQTIWEEHVKDITNQLQNGEISLQDTVIFLHLFDLITGKRGDTSIRFVFIDEIQDYTPYQLAYLRYSFPKARFTMLGDLNQTIFVQQKQTNLLSEMKELFNGKKVTSVQLAQTYRSTKQITNFSKEILIGGQEIIPFERKGDIPTLFEGTDETQIASKLVELVSHYSQKDDGVAVITKSFEDAQKVNELLENANEKVVLISSENQRLSTGNIIVPAYLAKGLEFDNVIIWKADDSRYQAENERELLYTVSSRAMHELTLIALKKKSSLLSTVNSENYQLVEI